MTSVPRSESDMYISPTAPRDLIPETSLRRSLCSQRDCETGGAADVPELLSLSP